MPNHSNIENEITCIIKVKNLTVAMFFKYQYFYFSSLILKKFSKKFKLFLNSHLKLIEIKVKEPKTSISLYYKGSNLCFD
jgi:hypothetical protein